MRRILTVLAVALVMVAVMGASAMPALAVANQNGCWGQIPSSLNEKILGWAETMSHTERSPPPARDRRRHRHQLLVDASSD